MQKVSKKHGVPNLTRDNVFTISKAQLDRIRNSAIEEVVKEIKLSNNEIEIISTPALFYVRPWADYLDGRVDGLTLELIQRINPNTILVLIDDLLRVRISLLEDTLWRDKGITLNNLARSRQTAIQLVEEYCRDPALCNWLIFAKEHPIECFADVLLNTKPKLYISYRMTGETKFSNVIRFISKLSENFICIDPYSIKDWEIIKAYDKEMAKPETDRNERIEIEVPYREGHIKFSNIPLAEIHETIDNIRTQIVQRDLQLITCTHATVIHHGTEEPSYGVMTELIHSATEVSHPVYVLYPFKTRLSPFFEHYVRSENMISGDINIERLEDQIVEKLLADYESWPTWSD